MWSYIARRLLLMIPTLFGITIVSFTIMQLAPGDPLLFQLGSTGAAGTSSQTREQYLVQKRDLKLDKPLLLNFRYFSDYETPLRIAAHYRSRRADEIEREIPQLARTDAPADLQSRLAFLRSLKIQSFEERLRDPAQHARLARAIEGHVMIFAEDAGKHGVPAAVKILRETDDVRLKIGAIRSLSTMVLDPFVYTYTRTPEDSETPPILSTWRTWWDRNRKAFPAPAAERAAHVKRAVAELAGKTSHRDILDGMDAFRKDDAAILMEILTGPSSLSEKLVSSLALSLHVGKPLKVDVPLDADPDQVQQVAENWIGHYEAHASRYHPGLGARLLYVLTDTQYAHMVWRLITFDFGRSALKTRDPVSKKIWDAVKVSAPLMLMAQAMIYLLAVPLGIVAAVKKGKWQDHSISLGLFLLYSVPNFVAAMLFLVFLCYGDFLKLFPMMNLHSFGSENFGTMQYLFDYLWHAFLPVTCLALFSLAGLAMYSRTSMLDVVNQDYIRTARAKGLPPRKVILKHALRNALIPIITLFANFIPAMLGGSVLIEVLFNIPGMGRLSFTSIEQKDFPTLMALIYIDAIVVMVSILLSDILYAFVDPRIHFGSRGRAS